MILAFVLVGGAIGAVVRAGITNLDGSFSRQLTGTMVANIAGSFALGWLTKSASDTIVVIVGTGFIGALTTFSTFVAQIECIGRQGTTARATVYCVGSLVGGLAAAYLGWTL